MFYHACREAALRSFLAKSLLRLTRTEKGLTRFLEIIIKERETALLTTGYILIYPRETTLKNELQFKLLNRICILRMVIHI